MNEWNYSGTIAVDSDKVHIDDLLFYFLGKWHSSAEIIELVTNAIESFANIVADALRGLVEWIEHFMSERLPEITEIIETVCKKHKRNRWLPVRYIGVNDRRTDRRPQVHRIRNALPNMYRNRRMKRKGD